jgi:hypothetical protein
MNSIRCDLENALATWTSDGDEAFEIAEQMFDSVIATIRKRYPDLSLAAAELLLADAKRDAEADLFALLHNTLDRDDAIDVVARVLGED